MSFSGSGVKSIAHRSDVALSSPAASQLLTYDAAIGKWRNSSLAATTESCQLVLANGNLAVGDNILKPGIFMLQATTLTTIQASVGGAPAGGAIGLTVRQGTAVLGHVVIADGARTATPLSGLNAAVAITTPITFDITDVGSTTTGSDLSVLLQFDSAASGVPKPYIDERWQYGGADSTLWTTTDTFTSNGGTLNATDGALALVLPSGSGGSYGLQLRNSRGFVPAAYDVLFSLDWTATPRSLMPTGYASNNNSPACNITIQTERVKNDSQTAANILNVRSDGAARLLHLVYGSSHNANGSDGSTTATFAPGSKIWVRYRHNGPNDLRYRLWADGQAEPSTWNETFVPTYSYSQPLPAIMPGLVQFNVSVTTAQWNLVIGALQFLAVAG